MGWYAHLTYHEMYDFMTYEEMIEDVQFFIDCMTIEDDGEHYRGAYPRDAIDREEMYLHQLWCEIA